jgi:chaperonin GroES
MKLKPLQDWAIIVPSEAEVRTAGGIYIPDTAKEKPAEGVVEAIGPGALEEEEKYGKKKKEQKERKFIPTTVKPGDRVLYEEYAGQKIMIGNEELVLVRERNILGTLPPKPATPKVELPPLQIPAVTSSSRETALVKTQRPGSRGQGPAAAKEKGQRAISKVQGKAKKKAPAKTKKAAKKVVKKAAKKTAMKKGPGSRGQGPVKTKKGAKKLVKKAKQK